MNGDGYDVSHIIIIVWDPKICCLSLRYKFLSLFVVIRISSDIDATYVFSTWLICIIKFEHNVSGIT